MTNWGPGEALTPFRGWGSEGLTCGSLRDMRLGSLRDAVAKWEMVRGKLETLASEARHDLLGAARESGWRGENADVTKPFIRETARKFQWAHDQAAAVHSILNTLAGDLTEAQRRLRELTQLAESQELILFADGRVRWAKAPDLTLENAPVGNLTPSASDYSVDPALQQAMDDIEVRVREIVAGAAESDSVAARALSEITERRPGEFSHSPYESLDDAHEAYAREGAEQFMRLAGRETEWTASDLAKMSRLLAEYSDEPEFAEHLVDSMGVAEYLLLADRLDTSATELASAGLTRPILAENLREGMGTALTTAMQPPDDMSPHAPGMDAYQARLAALQEAGRDRLFNPNGGPMEVSDNRYGYDVTLDLLEASDATIDEQFYNSVMSDLVAWEKDDPSVWERDRFHSGRYPGPWGPENDLVDRMLGIGAENNPEAVAAFFDPEDRDTKDNLDYFIGDGDHSRGSTIESPLESSPGLAAALETAATGLPPGATPGPFYEGHSDANIRIAEEVWNTFAEDTKGISRVSDDGDMTHLKPALGAIAADYMQEIQYAADNTPRAIQQAGVEATFNSAHTGTLLREIGENQEAYERITAANQAQLHLDINSAAKTDWEEDRSFERAVKNTVERGGLVTGILADAHATSMYENQISADEAHNSTVDDIHKLVDRSLSAAIVGSTVNAPLAGLGLEAIKSDITESVAETFRVDNSIRAEQESQSRYDDSRRAYQEHAAEFTRNALRMSDANLSDEARMLLIDEVNSGAETGFIKGVNRDHSTEW